MKIREFSLKHHGASIIEYSIKSFHRDGFIRLAAGAGIVGPLLLTSTLVALTIAQWDFLRSLRWHPLTAPTTDWPSGLALGPYGGWMTATFVVCGLLLMVFAQGLRQTMRGSQREHGGTLLLTIAGGAMIALVAPTDPTFGGGPPTVAGRLHDLAFGVLGITFWLALVLLARSFRRDARWKRYAPFTWCVAALIIPAFVLKGLLFYVFLLAIVLWCEAIAMHLRHS